MEKFLDQQINEVTEQTDAFGPTNVALLVALNLADKVVDTTGAGDLYAAGFLFGYTAGLDHATCGSYGAQAAAEIISHYGARPKVRLSDLVAV